jgi:peroxiredoxin
MNSRIILILFIPLLFGLSSFKEKEVKKSVIGKSISKIELLNVDGSMYNIDSIKGAKGFMVVFTCNHCPFAKLYPERLNALHRKFEKLGVPLIAINSMDSIVYEEETFSLMRSKSAESKFEFAYLQDGQQLVGKEFGAEHTPHAFVIWRVENRWVIKYSGAIDNNGEHPELATPYLATVVSELLENKATTLQETESFGCRIFYRK